MVLDLNQYETRMKSNVVEKNKIKEQEPNFFECKCETDFFCNLPKIIWDNHDEYINLYNETWKLAYKNIKNPTSENGFVSAYIDTAFNDCTFLWDSVFIVQFAKYAKNAFDFMGTIDNFYSKQHDNGFICREIETAKGKDRFEEFDLTSTGPNILAYCEWENYKYFGDKDRLRKVFYPLVGYYRWFRLYRSWQNGSYWNSGWGCGLDNSPRFDKSNLLTGFDDTMGFDFFHGYHTWLDATVHQALSGKILAEMAAVLNYSEEISDIVDEVKFLIDYINNSLWDDTTGFYYDCDRYGKLTGVKTIIAFWTLLAKIPNEEQTERLIAHLSDENSFKTVNPIPSLSVDNLYFSDDPLYWQGGAWAATNYMVLQGLYEAGRIELVNKLAIQSLDNVLKVYNQTHKIWEYYNPVKAQKGAYAKPDFVGWSGLIPISILIEYVFGIHIDAQNKTVHWYISMTDRHGIEKMPIFNNGTLSVICDTFDGDSGFPVIIAKSNTQLTLVVHYKNIQRKYLL